MSYCPKIFSLSYNIDRKKTGQYYLLQGEIRKEGNLTREEANNILGDVKYTGFLKGLEAFSGRYGFRPIKVPVYVRSALMRTN